MKAQEKRVQEIKKRFSQGFADVDVTEIKKNLDKYVGSDSSYYREAGQSYKKLLSLKKEIETGVSDDSFKKTLSDNDIEKKWNEYGSVLEKCNNQIKAFKNESSGITKPFNQLDAVTASNRTLTWSVNNMGIDVQIENDGLTNLPTDIEAYYHNCTMFGKKPAIKLHHNSNGVDPSYDVFLYYTGNDFAGTTFINGNLTYCRLTMKNMSDTSTWEYTETEMPVNITDEHINTLIDKKLGVIENGTY